MTTAQIISALIGLACGFPFGMGIILASDRHNDRHTRLMGLSTALVAVLIDIVLFLIVHFYGPHDDLPTPPDPHRPAAAEAGTGRLRPTTPAPLSDGGRHDGQAR